MKLLKEEREKRVEIENKAEELEGKCRVLEQILNRRAYDRARALSKRYPSEEDEDIIDSLISPEPQTQCREKPRGRTECDCGGACARSYTSETDDEEGPDSVS